MATHKVYISSTTSSQATWIFIKGIEKFVNDVYDARNSMLNPSSESTNFISPLSYYELPREVIQNEQDQKRRRKRGGRGRRKNRHSESVTSFDTPSQNNLQRRNSMDNIAQASGNGLENDELFNAQILSPFCKLLHVKITLIIKLCFQSRRRRLGRFIMKCSRPTVSTRATDSDGQCRTTINSATTFHK